jgi:hypothetical protein
MPQSRYRSGGFTPPFSGWRGKPAATFDTETEALRKRAKKRGRRGEPLEKIFSFFPSGMHFFLDNLR